MAPETRLTADVDAILAAVTPRTKIVFLANPNNPTGTYLPFDEVKRLHAGLPPHVLLVLDAAYAEYVRRNDYESGLELVATERERRDDAHVLEDLRARRSAPRLDGTRPAACRRRAEPHPRARSTSTAPAIAAGIAALGDDGACRRAPSPTTTNGCAWLTREIAALGLEVTPSVGNFLLMHFPQAAGRTARGRGCAS